VGFKISSVSKNIVEGGMEPCGVIFFGRKGGGSARVIDVCWYGVGESQAG